MLAAGALVLFYLFFVPKPAPAAPEVALPLSTEQGEDGYQALWRWLQSQGVPVTALRNPYTHLTRDTPPAPAGGNILITTLPHRLPARLDELRDLAAWIRRGNTLLVMAALDDTPRWELGIEQGLHKTLERMTQMSFVSADTQKPAGAAGPKDGQWQSVIEPKGAHPLFDGVRSVLAISEFPAYHWEPKILDGSAVIEIGQRQMPGREHGTLKPAIWLKSEGDGQIIVFSFAGVFSNRAIAERDNAVLLSNIVAWSRTAHGRVIFDDDHQGAVSYYDATAFFHDPRLHHTVLWLLLLWLVFVLGAQRMRPRVDRWNPADVTQFIGVTAGFFSSALAPAAAAERLFDNFFRRIPALPGSRADDDSAWTWLSRRGLMNAAQMAELRHLHARTKAGKPVDLVRLQNILSRLTGTIK
jgi:hypothetical protein